MPTVHRQKRSFTWSNLSVSSAFVIVFLLYLSRIANWLGADITGAELVTVTRLIGGGPGGPWAGLPPLIRSDTSIVFDMTARAYLSLGPLFSAPLALRFFSVGFGVATLFLVVNCWRRWIGPSWSFLAALIFAFSPIYAPHTAMFHQYSLNMFLGALLVTGTMKFCFERSGTVMVLASAFLLTVLSPLNLALLLSMTLFALLHSGVAHPLAGRVRGTWPFIVPALVGMALMWRSQSWWAYTVSADPEAFGSTWAVALLLHLGPLILLFFYRCVHLRRRGMTQAWLSIPTASNGMFMAGVLVCCVIGLLSVMKILPRPAHFLPLLPACTLAVTIVCRDWDGWKRAPVHLMAAFIVLHGFFWERCLMLHARSQETVGIYLNTLLVQWDRGGSGASETAMFSRNSQLFRQRVFVLCSTTDYMQLRYYWRLYGMNPEQLVAAELIVEGGMPPGLSREWRFAAVAPSELEAASLFAAAGVNSPFQVAFRGKNRNLYVIR